jgi:DNA polymerase-1
MPKKLVLFDGHALAYRSYFAFIANPLTNSRGENTSAVYGFVNSILKILDMLSPDYVGMAMDSKKPTFRHEKYPDYKANRAKMPDDLQAQMVRIREVVDAMNIPVFEKEGFEADDLIGTIAEKSGKLGIEVYIISSDKDLFQLVNDRIFVVKPGRGGKDIEFYDRKKVTEKLDCEPERVADLLGLMGDTSDNIPGVPGIGQKTAAKLLREYGSLRNIRDNLSAVKQNKLKENLAVHIEQAMLSMELATLNRTVEFDFDMEDLRSSGWDTGRLRALFLDLGFISLLNRLEGTEKEEKVEYQIVDTPRTLASMIEGLTGSHAFAIDTETTSMNPMQADLVGISLSCKPGEAYYIPVGHVSGCNLSLEIVREQLRPLLENESVLKIGQNIKYDLIVLERAHISLSNPIFDTMIASYLLEPSRRQHNLDSLVQQYCNHRMIPIRELIGKGKKQIPFSRVEIEKGANYSCEDADYTFRLKELLAPKLADAGLRRLYEDVEIPLVRVLMHMETAGVAIDSGLLQDMSVEMEVMLANFEEEIHRIAGEEFNINSPKQLSEILFDKLNLPAPKKTKTGFSTDISVLEYLATLHELPAKILNYRQIAKLKSTYVDALPRMVNRDTGRIHTSFNQTVTSTGRLSSSDPNLQNIPIRSEIGREIRRAFIPGMKGWILLSADYSQIELRILAHLSKDRNLLRAFEEDIDIHRQTASLIFDIPPDRVDHDARARAKVVNFGVIYGMGAWGLSQSLQIPQNRAEEFITSYFDKYPGVKSYQEHLIEECREHGYVTTLLSRKRFLPEIDSSNAQVRKFAERVAINTPIQGSAADLIKISMIRIYERMMKEQLKSRMILQVHDELVFEVPGEEVDAMKSLVREEMETGLTLDIPLKVSLGTGDNWLEAH